MIIYVGGGGTRCPGSCPTTGERRFASGEVDLRWLAPLDEEAIRSAATRANGKVVVAHEANVTQGLGSEIVARLHERSENGAPLRLKDVGTPNVRFPAMPSLSQELLRNAKRIADAARAAVK